MLPTRREVWPRDLAIAAFQATWASTTRPRSSESIPANEDVSIYCHGRLARSVPRTAFSPTAEDRRRLQADEDRRRLLARRCQERATPAHLWHRLARQERTGRLSPPAGGGGEARPSQARQRAGTVHLLAGCRRGAAAVDAQRNGDPPGTGIPRAAGRAQRRLSPRRDSAHHQGGALFPLAPSALLRRRHVFAARYRRRELLSAADELPAPSS